MDTICAVAVAAVAVAGPVYYHNDKIARRARIAVLHCVRKTATATVQQQQQLGKWEFSRKQPLSLFSL